MSRVNITKQELTRLLKTCNSGDRDRDHTMADQFLLWHIDDQEVIDAFNEIKKLYDYKVSRI